jgi:hypothetical protein
MGYNPTLVWAQTRPLEAGDARMDIFPSVQTNTYVLCEPPSLIRLGVFGFSRGRGPT